MVSFSTGRSLMYVVMTAPPSGAGATHTTAPAFARLRGAGTPKSRAMAADPSSTLSSLSSQQPSHDDHRGSAPPPCGAGDCAAAEVTRPATSKPAVRASERRVMACLPTVLSEYKGHTARELEAREIDRVEVDEVGAELCGALRVAPFDGRVERAVDLQIDARERMTARGPALRPEDVREHVQVHVIHEVPGLREVVIHRTAAGAHVGHDAAGDIREAADVAAARCECQAKAGDDVRGLERRVLLDGIEIVVNEVAIFGGFAALPVFVAALDVETRVEGLAEIDAQPRRVEIPFVDRQLVGHEIEQIAPGARKKPRAAERHRSRRPAEQEVRMAVGLWRLLLSLGAGRCAIVTLRSAVRRKASQYGRGREGDRRHLRTRGLAVHRSHSCRTADQTANPD